MNPSIVLQKWEFSVTYHQALALWLNYYRVTEAYDRAIGCPPSRYTPGGVCPVTTRQHQLSNRFAKQAMKDTTTEAWSHGIYPQEWEEAKTEACELHAKELRTGVLTEL